MCNNKLKINHKILVKHAVRPVKCLQTEEMSAFETCTAAILENKLHALFVTAARCLKELESFTKAAAQRVYVHDIHFNNKLVCCERSTSSLPPPLGVRMFVTASTPHPSHRALWWRREKTNTLANPHGWISLYVDFMFNCYFNELLGWLWYCLILIEYQFYIERINITIFYFQ